MVSGSSRASRATAATNWTVAGRPWQYDPTAWGDTCFYVISMEEAALPRAALQAQLRTLGLPRASHWPGVDMGGPAVDDLIRKYLNAGYLDDGPSADVRRLTAGLTGTMLAHLSLWEHTLHADLDGLCSYTMIFVRSPSRSPRSGEPSTSHAGVPRRRRTTPHSSRISPAGRGGRWRAPPTLSS